MNTSQATTSAGRNSALPSFSLPASIGDMAPPLLLAVYEMLRAADEIATAVSCTPRCCTDDNRNHNAAGAVMISFSNFLQQSMSVLVDVAQDLRPEGSMDIASRASLLLRSELDEFNLERVAELALQSDSAIRVAELREHRSPVGRKGGAS